MGWMRRGMIMSNFSNTYVFSSHSEYFPRSVLDVILSTNWRIGSHNLDDLLLKLTIDFIEESREG